MFSFFGNKDTPPPVEVFSARLELYKWLVNQLRAEPTARIIYFFSDTQAELALLLQAANVTPQCLLNAAALRNSIGFGGGPVYVAEIHPLNSTYKSAATSLRHVSVVRFLTHLDDPLFERFGKGNIKSLMSRLGMKSDEIIKHPMIAKALQRAQQKLEAGLTRENEASSAAEWFRLNARG